MVTEVQVNIIVRLWQSVHHSVPSSAPLRKRLNVREWDCRAVHEKAALWVMGAIHSEGHQSTTYHPALRHAQDVPEISQSPLSDRTHQVEHWGCGCVPIVLASDDMQASAVESVDTAHHCSSQQLSCSSQYGEVSAAL